MNISHAYLMYKLILNRNAHPPVGRRMRMCHSGTEDAELLVSLKTNVDILFSLFLLPRIDIKIPTIAPTIHKLILYLIVDRILMRMFSSSSSSSSRFFPLILSLSHIMNYESPDKLSSSSSLYANRVTL